MKRCLLWLIQFVTPAADREWVIGDTIEEFERLEQSEGSAPAHRWIRWEVCRIVRDTPRHRRAVHRSPPGETPPKGDRPMVAVWHDVRYALRGLGRSPGFAAIAIVTLALGIGANTAMFAVINAVLLKPLPFRDADRLMLVHTLRPEPELPGIYREGVWSYPKYQTFLRAQDVFEETALFSPRDFNVAGEGEPEKVRGELITDRYPLILGIDPILGRTFTREEAHVPGAAAVAVIGHGLWARRFGSDRDVVGRRLDLNGRAYMIVGVLPPGFRGLDGAAQVWVPLAVVDAQAMTPKWQYSHSYYLIARRKVDVPEATAAAAVRVAGRVVDRAHPGRPEWSASAASLHASRADADVRRASYVLLGAVGFVLVIACVNLTNLIWARAIGRRREVAVRVAIGASRKRIITQFLAEGAVLATIGAAAGLFLAWALLATASNLLPESEVFFRTPMWAGAPRTSGTAGLTRIGAAMIGLDGRTLIFTCGVAIVTALLVSLAPALQTSVLRPVDALKSGGKSMTERGLQMFSARTGLVTVQIALALILMAGAGLMIRSASRLSTTDIGVNPDGVLTLRLDLPGGTYTSDTGRTFLTQLVDRVRQLPGIESVGLGNCAPVSGGCNATGIRFPSRPRDEPADDPIVGVYWATPEYFSTLGIRLLTGRSFTEHDRVGQPNVVLVSETAARQFWPNDTPLGKKIEIGQGFHESAEVVGVVSNVRYRSLETEARPDVYVPLSQSHQSRMRMFIRARLDTRTLVSVVTREVRALDPNLPLSDIKSMDDWVGDAMWRTRVGVWLLSAFAALALLMTAIGIFGVMAQTVMQRTAEIGIRMALGAQRRDVLALVLGGAALVTCAGIAVGVGCGLVLTRLMSALLYDVPPHDPLTFAAVAALLTLVALAACYLPARRATRVDAVVALRSE